MFKSKASSHALDAASTTIIGAGTTITGDIQCNGDIRIDGILKGNLNAKSKVIIGAEGLIEGDIYGKQADVMGEVNGKINITDLLYLHAKSTVNGDIIAGQLQIDPAAVFNGKCQMGGNVIGNVNVIELNTNVERLALASE